MTFPKAADGVFVQECAEEVVVYDERREDFHLLNQTSAFVFQHCDGKTSPAQLSAKLAERFGLNAEEAGPLVGMSLDLLQEADLVTGTVVRKFEISKRQFLRRASAAAVIPVVYSMTAPAMAMMTSIPGNDNCENRLVIPNDKLPVSVQFDTRKATTDGAACCNGDTGKDIWYNFTAPDTDGYCISTTGTGAGFTTVISVWAGCFECPPSGVERFCCQGGGGTTTLPVELLVDKCYKIRIAGIQGQSGTGTLTIALDDGTCSCLTPPCD